MAATNRYRRRAAAVVCALALVTACGSDEDTSSDDSTPTTDNTVAETTVDSTAAETTVADTTPDTTVASTTPPEDTAAADGGGPGREEVVATFMEAGLNERTANCVADKFEEEFGADVFDRDEPPADIQAKSEQYGEECALQTVSVPADAEGREGFVQILTSGGLTTEAANCVAGKVEEAYGADIFDAAQAPAELERDVQQFGDECARELSGN